jgi:hypothetical protein
MYTEAKDKIKHEAITPYVIIALDTFVTNIYNNRCIADTDKMIDILQAAYDNPFLAYRPRYRSILYHLEAGLQLMNQQFSRCRALLLEAFQTYPKSFDPLIEKAYLEMEHGLYESAQETIDLLHCYRHSPFAPTEQINDLDRMLLISKLKIQEKPPHVLPTDPEWELYPKDAQ